MTGKEAIKSIEKDLEALEAYNILNKHHLIGNIEVNKVSVGDVNGTHIEYELRYVFITIFITEEEYEVLKEWLENGNYMHI